MGDKQDAALEVVTGVAAAGVGLATQDPFAVLGVAAALPAARSAAEHVLDRLRLHRQQRAEAVLVAAAQHAKLTVDELVGRLQRSAAGEDLLTLTMRAAHDASLSAKLYALAAALANGARNEAGVSFESTFVRAINDLDAASVQILASFGRSANDLGLGSGGVEFDEPVNSLNSVQLATAHPGLTALLDPLLAVLQRHGLIAPITSGGGTFFGGGGQRLETWGTTPFGEEVAARLRAIDDVVR